MTTPTEPTARVRCALCGLSAVYTGEDAVELAQMYLEDGGHSCVDVGDTP